MPTPPELVIFDCDGVLVDSEPIANRVLAQVVSSFGKPMTTEECFARFHGGHLSGVLAFLHDEAGVEPTDELRRDIRDRIDAALANEVVAIDGAEEVLDALDRAGVPYVAASNGPMEKMRVTLGKTGLWDRFHPRIYSAWDVGALKPDPGLFLHAAREAGAEPARCAVVEDSNTGVRAAVAAGMTCYARTAYIGPDAARARGAVPIDDMRELVAALLPPA